MRETAEEERETVARVETAPEAFDLPGCVQERHQAPDGRAPSASRSPQQGWKTAQRGGSTREKEPPPKKNLNHPGRKKSSSELR